MAITARRDALLRRAIDAGVPPTAAGIGRAAGIADRTMRDVLAGHPVSSRTFDALQRLFPDSAEELFDLTGPRP
jgi:hypothetical protein